MKILTIPEAIAAKAREALGTPFHHQGRLVNIGLDCVGLGVFVAESFGVRVADTKTYSEETDGDALKRGLESACYKIPIEDARLGDVLEFQRGRDVHHMAIIVEENPRKIVHAVKKISGGRVQEEPIPPHWKKGIVGAWRLKVH